MPPFNATDPASNGEYVDEDIVISGMSGRFPSSHDVDEFAYHLYNKLDMVNDDESRFEHTNPLIPRRSGKIPDIDKFDASFFAVHKLQVDNMDPQIRMLIEEAFKAIMDAGINPVRLRGSNTGVYVGSSISETESLMIYSDKNKGFGMSGCAKAMFANRISYTLGLNGPSLSCDTACSSSMSALDLAVRALNDGVIDAAIVGGSNLCLHPHITLQFAMLGVLSPEGVCRPFDSESNGYVRSEAVSCIFLQKKRDAKRIYGTVIYTQVNCDGFKLEGITYPSSKVQQELLTQIYSVANINMDDIGYVEGHCTATIVGDPEECKAIDNAICKQRTQPLYIGSVKSNCGHAEPASGMCSIAKVLLTMNKGVIPPNIGLRNKKESIEALRTGRLRVVTELTKLPKPYVGLNSFGFGGANGHALLKQHDKVKAELVGKNVENALRLVTWAGRTEKAVLGFLNDLETEPLDEEYLALASASQEGGIQGMVYRGYSVLKVHSHTERPVAVRKSVQHFPDEHRPIVWVFSGMGSQWPGMGKDLMQLPTFRQSIQRSHNVLKPSGLNLIDVITSDDPKTFDNILNSFVGIAAMQIALVDVLRALNITPDLIIGHSVGELGCAYADNCFTAEQMILAAYYRGKVSLETEKIRGSMAAIGMGYNDIKNLLPASITAACHNNQNSCTISGPCEDVAKLVAQLEAKNIFAREVPCSNIAYHSKHIAQFGPKLLKYLKHIVTSPKQRSEKWISTSVPEAQWSEDIAKYSSAEYHTNNLLGSVLFEEGLAHIPKNALTIEIAPHALLQSILKEALGHGMHVGITKRGVEDSTAHLLNALGSLYINGITYDVTKLYPSVEFPVSRGTKILSSHIQFNHADTAKVMDCEFSATKRGKRTFSLKLSELEQLQYLLGHEIDGRTLIPATFYLECVWKTFASMMGKQDYATVPIVFENVRFVRATTLTSADMVELTVIIHRTGDFEVSEAHSSVATGTIRQAFDTTLMVPKTKQQPLQMTKKDFYKELKLRGYHYHGEFQGVKTASLDGTHGQIEWTGNWVTFMDCMLQLSILHEDSRNLMLPTRLRRLKIHPQLHQSTEAGKPMDVYFDTLHKRITAGGIEITELTANTVARRKAPGDPVLEKYEFVPHLPAPKLSHDDIARCCIQLVLENHPRSKVQIIEFEQPESGAGFLMNLLLAVGDLPLITGNCVLYHNSRECVAEEITGITHVYPDELLPSVSESIVVMKHTDVAQRESSVLQNIDVSGYLIIRDAPTVNIDKYSGPQGFVPIAYFPTATETFVLLKRQKVMPSEEATYLRISSADTDFKWLQQLQRLTKTSKAIILVSENEPFSGLLGLVNCLRKEPETSNIRGVFIDDPKAPAFKADTPFYAKQLRLGLGINVYRKGAWGTYRHLQLSQAPVVAPQTDGVHGDILRIGDFSSLTWLQSPVRKDKSAVKIVYSSLNFRDIMLASGRLAVEAVASRKDQTCVFGFEYSGINRQTGKRIMGMVFKSAVSSYLKQQGMLAWDIPDKWSLREAATVPVVYLTVYYAFFFNADIRTGKSILIHAGSGGVGIAAIRVALAYGLEVYTTVSTAEKRAFLLKTFPALKDNHIGYSRDLSFEEMILEQTKGKGVDFVLNSLSEDKLKASIRCLAQTGHFLEIGKFDFVNDNSLELGYFIKELSFHAVLADNLLTEDIETVKAIKEFMAKDIANGIIEPLPSTVYKAHEIEQAFRFLMSGKHIGKVLIQVHEDGNSEATLPIAVLPQIYFEPELVYVVPGGLGGFGLELVDWMIIRGARKLVLSSSRGISNAYQQLRISIWKSYEAEILINTSDIGTMEGCRALLTEAMKLGPVGGIFNLAVVLKDSLFENQTTEQFLESFRPKALATKYLDELSRKLCPKLHHFVIFSSVSCGRGNAGQTNYGMTNSIMERIIEDRLKHGLAGKAIQWGAVGEVGLVAQMAEGKIDLEIGGTLQQRISSCLQVLDVLISSPDAVVSSMVVAEKKIQAAGLTPMEFVLNTLSIRDVNSISMSSTLAELGMDSLTGVEIKQTFEREYDIVLNSSDLRALTFVRLMELSENAKNKTKVETVVSDEESRECLRQFYGQIGSMHLGSQDSVLDRVNSVSQGTPIIVLPGIDGCSGEVWQSIGKKLSAPTYVLQYHQANEAVSLAELVDFAIEHICKCLEQHQTKEFQIVGYSFGALLAHVVVTTLESKGYTGKLLLIDGSPFWVQQLISTLENLYKDAHLDKMILTTILSVLLPDLQQQTIERDVRHRLGKEEVLLYIHQQLRKHEYKDLDKVMCTIEAVYQRVKIIQKPETYQNIVSLNANVMLLTPTIDTIANFDEYFGLSLFTRNFIQVERLDGNHRTILQNSQLPDCISKYFAISEYPDASHQSLTI